MSKLAITRQGEVTFIVGDIANAAELAASIGGEVYVLDANGDALQQMASLLEGRAGLGAVHILSHGDEGVIRLGSLKLDAEGLEARKSELAVIGASLAPDGDILIYGCDVGASDSGRLFIDRLAQVTGADVAASNNLTGGSAMGGDWVLELSSGQIDTAPIVDADLAATYSDVLSLGPTTVNFESGNDLRPRAGTNNTEDLIYWVNSSLSYELLIDGADTSIRTLQGFSYADGAESQVEIRFLTGQRFTPTSIALADLGGVAIDLTLRGYDAQGAAVGSPTIINLSQGDFTTAYLYGMTGISVLRIKPNSSDGLFYLSMDDLVISSATPPPAKVVSVESPASGAKKAGDVIDIEVIFDRAVQVSGSPTLKLATSANGGLATYVDGGGTSRLNFRYTVQAGDNSPDLDYVGTSALSLNGGSITGVGSGLDAILTLAAPGVIGSLGGNRNIVVDTIAPTMAITSNKASLGGADTATITFTFSEAPSGFDLSDLTVSGGTLGALSGAGATRQATFTPSANFTGTASITVASGAYTDAAGNGGGSGASPSISIDTQAPAAPAAPRLISASDSGSSASDGVTKVNTPTFSGAAGSAEANATVRVYADATLVAETTANGDGSWSAASSVTLADKSYAVTAVASDSFGNASASSDPLAITIITATPTVSIASSANALRSGQTATITFTFSQDPGATFTWDGSAGDVVVTGGTLSAISGSGATRTAIFTPTAATNSGTASITVNAGSYADLAGNFGAQGASPTLIFDTLPPAAPTALTLDAASDLGVSSSDQITSDSTPTITGSGEAGSTVTLYSGASVIGSGAVSNGAWSITPSSALPQGVHTITAVAVDGFGNTSQASDALSLIIDTTAPTTTISSDKAALKAGETATITFTLSEDDQTTFSAADIQVSGGTLGVLTKSGTIYSAVFTPTASVDNGTASLAVSAGSFSDAAGNLNAPASLSFSYDTLPPAAPSAPDLAASSDTGPSNSDNITTDTTPTFSGTAQNGATVRLYAGAALIGSDVATGGAWTITASSLAVGSHQITAIATDPAGNIGAASSPLSVQIIGNAAPTGAVTITGAAQPGQTLTVSNTLADVNGLGVVSYQWRAGGIDILGATGSSLVLGQDQLGKAIDVVAKYTDGYGFNEQVTSAATAPVAVPAPDPQPEPQPEFTAPEIRENFATAAGFAPTSSKALASNITLADGTVVANPAFETAVQLAALIARFEAGAITKDGLIDGVVELSAPTSGVALQAYQFFTGSTPSQAGMAWLIDSPDNPNDLTDAYYARFNEVNRFINFAVNLGTQGEGKAAFDAKFGALDFAASVRLAYDMVIGLDAARAAGINVDAALSWIASQEGYFDAFAGSDLGGKAAMIGYIMQAGFEAKVGRYYQAAHDFIEDSFDGAPAYQVDLVGGQHLGG